MLVNGKVIAGEVLKQLKSPSKDGRLRLAAILVDHLPGLKKFVQLKKLAAEEVGIDLNLTALPSSTSEENLRKIVQNIVAQEDIGGVLVELPLPTEINAQAILDLIPSNKDVDVLSSELQNNFYLNKSIILPPTVEALKIVFQKFNLNPKNRKAAVFGQGILVGKPIAHWLEQQGAIVTKIDEFTKNPEKISKEAEIVISGVGEPHFIKPDMIHEGAIVIDYGYENKDGRMVGDVDPAVNTKASIFASVPGGMGPITIAAMLKNFITLISERGVISKN